MQQLASKTLSRIAIRELLNLTTAKDIEVQVMFNNASDTTE